MMLAVGTSIEELRSISACFAVAQSLIQTGMEILMILMNLEKQEDLMEQSLFLVWKTISFERGIYNANVFRASARCVCI